VLEAERADIAVVEWGLAGDHLEQHDAERVLVGALVGGHAADLLGRDVAGRAEHVVRGGLARRVGIAQLGEPEIDELDAVVGDDEDVGGRDVGVDDAVVVRDGERLAQLAREHHGLGRCERTAVDHRAEARAGEQLHDEVRAAVREVAEVEDVDDVGVLDPCRGARLAQEAVDAVRVALQHTPVQHLERARPAERGMLGLIDAAHATGIEPGEHAIVVDAIALLEVIVEVAREGEPRSAVDEHQLGAQLGARAQREHQLALGVAGAHPRRAGRGVGRGQIDPADEREARDDGRGELGLDGGRGDDAAVALDRDHVVRVGERLEPDEVRPRGDRGIEQRIDRGHRRDRQEVLRHLESKIRHPRTSSAARPHRGVSPRLTRPSV